MYVGSHCLVLGCFNDQVIHEQVTVSPSLPLPLSPRWQDIAQKARMQRLCDLGFSPSGAFLKGHGRDMEYAERSTVGPLHPMLAEPPDGALPWG